MHVHKNGVALSMTEALASATSSDSGAVSSSVDACIASVARKIKLLFGSHWVHIEISPDLPDVDLAPGLVEQVLMDILQHASDVAPDDSVIDITVTRENRWITVGVQNIVPTSTELIDASMVRALAILRRAGGMFKVQSFPDRKETVSCAFPIVAA